MMDRDTKELLFLIASQVAATIILSYLTQPKTIVIPTNEPLRQPENVSYYPSGR